LSIFLFSFEFVFFVVVWIVGHALDPQISAAVTIDDWPVVLVGCIMGASMGFHNVAVKETFSHGPSTTVVTMTLISVSSNFSNTLSYYLAKKSILPLSSAPDSSPAQLSVLQEKFRDSYSKFSSSSKLLVRYRQLQ
jgi:hypothetical protein